MTIRKVFILVLVNSQSNTLTVKIAGKKYKTNSLALHYVQSHRSEVPEREMKIIQEGIEYLKQHKENKQVTHKDSLKKTSKLGF